MADNKILNSKIFKFFCSMKLGIIMLIIFTAISIYAATFLEHNAALEIVYTSWWYNFILLLIIINILVCSINRFPVIIKKMKFQKTDVDLDWLEKLPNRKELNIKLNKNYSDFFAKILEKRKYKTKIIDSDNKLLIYGEKGNLGYLGSFVTHISIILIIASALYGVLGTYEDYEMGFPGDVIELSEIDFDIRIDDFEIAYREDDERSIEQYYSSLTVLDDGEEIRSERIYVNKPLRHEGVNIYQSTYGWGIRSEFVNTNTEESNDMLLVPGQTVYYPSLQMYLRIVQFFPDFTMTNDGHPYSRSSYPANPYVAFQFLNEAGQVIGTSQYFFEPINKKIDLVHGHTLEFVEYENYTGFQIVKQQGKILLLISSLLLFIGLLICLCIIPKRLWIYTENSMDNSVIIAGSSYRNKIGFNVEFEGIVDEIEKSGEDV